MDNIILIFICLVAGITLQKLKVFPANSSTVLNQFIIYIALPSITLFYIPKVDIGSRLLFPLCVSWIGFLLVFLFFNGLGKWFGWPKKLIGCLILTAGLGNTAFIGFPVIEALYGKNGLETAVVLDQAGTFVVMATCGIVVAAIYSGNEAETNVGVILRKIFTFPPFIAFLIGFAMNLWGYQFNDDVQLALQRLGKTIAPTALFAVGMQLKIDRQSKYWNFLTLGLLYKLMIMPAVIYVLYEIVFKGNRLETDVSIIESAMAPMIASSILANAYGLKPKLAGLMVGVGIPLSFITLDFWYWLLISF